MRTCRGCGRAGDAAPIGRHETFCLGTAAIPTPPRTVAKCPRGCGAEKQIGPLALHAKTCAYPFTLERLSELFEIVHTEKGCWLAAPIERVKPPSAGGREVYRLIAEMHLGRPLRFADKELACHWCDEKRCVNPDHIYVGDYFTNAQDSVRNGRHRGPDPAFMSANAKERWARRDGSIGRPRKST